jgi:hypothetical protein
MSTDHLAGARAIAERDHEAIMRRLAGVDFPWDYQRSMIDMGFAKGLAAPRVAGLIAAQGYFVARPQKRYDDTSIILVGFIKEGYSSERGARMMARMNEVHGRFHIRQDDYLYILTLLMFEPVRWNARFGWRRMTDVERLANYYFWREVGARMGITDIPGSYEACEAYNVAFERDNVHRTEASASLAKDLFKMLESWVPGPVRPWVKPGMTVLLDDWVRECYDLDEPPAWMSWLIPRALEARARVLGFLPRRRDARFYGASGQRTYPNGYTIEDLGPPADWAPPRRRRAAAADGSAVGEGGEQSA